MVGPYVMAGLTHDSREISVAPAMIATAVHEIPYSPGEGRKHVNLGMCAHFRV